jgi:hypothetical protein
MTRAKLIARAAPAIVRDVAGLLGGGLIAYGAWLVYEPVGYITLGAMLLAAAVINARRAD